MAEVHQTLQANDLRDKIRLQTDGGLKTGLDVVKAAMLGAESFGFGTAPMVALGCKYLRICHLNNCATGLATQRDDLRRDHYQGTVDKVVNYFHFVAQETREWLALLGVRSLEELVGRVDLLEPVAGVTPRQQRLDLRPLLHTDRPAGVPATARSRRAPQPFDKGPLAEQMVRTSCPRLPPAAPRLRPDQRRPRRRGPAQRRDRPTLGQPGHGGCADQTQADRHCRPELRDLERRRPGTLPQRRRQRLRRQGDGRRQDRAPSAAPLDL